MLRNLFLAVIFVTTIKSSLLLSSQEINVKNNFSTNNQHDIDTNSIINGKCSRPFNRNVKQFIIKPSKQIYNNDDLIILSCGFGTRKTHRCKNGTWEPLFDWISECPSINGSCSPILPIENGWYNSTDLNSPFSLGSKLDFKCQKGYSLIGAPAIICESGFKWSYKSPSCSQIIDNGAGPQRFSIYTIIILTCLISLLIILFSSIVAFLAYQRRKRNKIQNQWRRYFNGYTYRSSKRQITRRGPNDTQGTTVYTVPEAAQITDL